MKRININFLMAVLGMFAIDLVVKVSLHHSLTPIGWVGAFLVSYPWRFGSNIWSLFGGYNQNGSIYSIFGIYQSAGGNAGQIFGLCLYQSAGGNADQLFGLCLYQSAGVNAWQGFGLCLYQSAGVNAGQIFGLCLYQSAGGNAWQGFGVAIFRRGASLTGWSVTMMN